MMKTLSLALVTLLLVSTASSAPLYNIINLVKPGSENSGAISINNNGQIVGWIADFSEQRATLFDSSGNGNNIDLGVLLGGWTSETGSINDIGQIVGSANSDTGRYATFFDITGSGNNINLEPLADPGGYALSINNIWPYCRVYL